MNLNKTYTVKRIVFYKSNHTHKKKKEKINRRRHFNIFSILIGIQKIDLNCINEITLFPLYAQTPWRRDTFAIPINVLKWRKSYVKTNEVP